MTRIGVYPGTFDPPTLGHRDIIERASRLVDRLVIGVGVNPGKNPLFSLDERLALVKADVGPLASGGRIAVQSFSGLVVDFARAQGATVIVRGLRSMTDFDYEAQMAGMNGLMAPGVETVFLIAAGATQAIAATHIRDIARMGGDVTPFVTETVAQALRQKIAASVVQKS